jgi:hypothetical protein
MDAATRGGWHELLLLVVVGKLVYLRLPVDIRLAFVVGLAVAVVGKIVEIGKTVVVGLAVKVCLDTCANISSNDLILAFGSGGTSVDIISAFPNNLLKLQ